MEAGTSVGIICSQSLSQPITQISLSSFHHAGHKNTNQLIKQGVPRVEALVDQTIQPEESSNSFYIKNPSIKEVAKIVDMTVDALIDEYFLMEPFEARDLKKLWWYPIGVSSGFYHINPFSLLGAEDFILRICFKQEKMTKYQLSLFDILRIINNQITGNEVFFFASPQSETIIDMIMNPTKVKPGLDAKKLLLKILIKVIFPSKIFDSYIDGIKDITIVDRGQGSTGSTQNIAHKVCHTTGTNTFGLLQDNNASIDKKTLRTDHPKDMMHALGIEAARKILVEELSKAMFGNIKYDDKHINLLADFMTSKGNISSIKSISDLMNDKSVLTRASNERSIQLLKEACLKGVSSKISGVSESIIVGQRAHVGTGFFSTK